MESRERIRGKEMREGKRQKVCEKKKWENRERERKADEEKGRKYRIREREGRERMRN